MGGYSGPAGSPATACPVNTYCPAAVSASPKPCPAKTAAPAGSDSLVSCRAIAGYSHASAGNAAYGTAAAQVCVYV